jgi:RimJ/RimL family protein N-acetyltransferase
MVFRTKVVQKTFGENSMSVVLLCQWRDSDFEPHFEMNTDPEVTRCFPAVMTRKEASDSFVRLRRRIEERGWGLWAVDVDGAFAGMTGLQVPGFVASFTPCTEILWRLRREYWGRGIARAAAAQALEYGFSRLGLSEIVAYAAANNLRSIRLMERLNFARDIGGDFEHPAIPLGSALRSHVLYRRKPNYPPDPTPALRHASCGAGAAPRLGADHGNARQE